MKNKRRYTIKVCKSSGFLLYSGCMVCMVREDDLCTKNKTSPNIGNIGSVGSNLDRLSWYHFYVANNLLLSYQIFFCAYSH